MYALGLDTTSSVLTLGVTNFDQVYRTQTWDLGRDISMLLHQHLMAFLKPLKWSDLQWLVVAQGPGSFTGTRIGVVTGRTLAQQLHIPLYGISNLAAQAYAYASTSPKVDAGDRIAVEMPGQRGAIYGGQFTWTGQRLTLEQPIQCFAIDDWRQILSTETFQHHITPPFIEQGEICQAMLNLAHQKWQAGEQSVWQDVLPYYGVLAASPPSQP